MIIFALYIIQLILLGSRYSLQIQLHKKQMFLTNCNLSMKTIISSKHIFQTVLIRNYISTPNNNQNIEKRSTQQQVNTKQTFINNKNGKSFLQQNNYVERPYTPSQASKMFKDQIQLKTKSIDRCKLKQIYHQIHLYQNQIIPFDYDYFEKSLLYLSKYQNQLTIDEIAILMRQTIKYKIKFPIIRLHFQNEILRRVHKVVIHQIEEQEQNDKQFMKNLTAQLQAQSKDFFEILSQKEDNPYFTEQKSSKIIEQQKKQMVVKSIKTEKYRKVQKRPNKSIETSSIISLCQMVIGLESDNIQLHQLLIQALEIRNRKFEKSINSNSQQHNLDNNLIKSDANYLCIYTKMVVNLLHLYMKKFQTQRKMASTVVYTRRSVKNIYKLQSSYYPQIIKLFYSQGVLSTMNNSQLQNFASIIGSFPIKKRSFKKQLGIKMIGLFSKYQESNVQVLKPFIQYSSTDKKIRQILRKQIQQNNYFNSTDIKCLLQTSAEQSQIKIDLNKLEAQQQNLQDTQEKIY